jgi:hypothetical protein
VKDGHLSIYRRLPAPDRGADAAAKDRGQQKCDR